MPPTSCRKTRTSRLKPIYAGSYVDTLTKAVTATKAGQGPALAVTLAVDAYSLVDDELIVPFDSVASERRGPGLARTVSTRRSCATGRSAAICWGVPFQRSTIVMYWNKDAFREAGLDPEHAPATWEELADDRCQGDEARGRPGDALGHPGARHRFHLLAVPGLRRPGRGGTGQRQRHEG